MILPIVIFSTIGFLFADSILYKPRQKSPEQELGDAIAKYIDSLKERD